MCTNEKHRRMAETAVAFGSGFPLPWGPAMHILKWILIGFGGLILLPIIGFGFLYITDPVHYGRLATVRALLRANAHETLSLASVINDVNVHLTEDSTVSRFVTMVYMVIEPTTKTVCWVSAGHDPIIVYEPFQDDFSELGGEDIPLGVKGDWHFKEDQRDEWSEGTVMVIGTDGVWETRNNEGEMFGKDALREVIRRHAHRPSETICEAVSQALVAFRGKTQYCDDVTLVVIKFKPNAGEPSSPLS